MLMGLAVGQAVMTVGNATPICREGMNTGIKHTLISGTEDLQPDSPQIWCFVLNRVHIPQGA